jgi:HrpA-like RNA helicase
MAALPMHPRLAAMLVAAASMGEGALACTLAAILSERLRLTSMHLDTLIAGIDFYSGVKGEIESALEKLPGSDWRSELVAVMVEKEGKR